MGRERPRRCGGSSERENVMQCQRGVWVGGVRKKEGGETEKGKCIFTYTTFSFSSPSSKQTAILKGRT